MTKYKIQQNDIKNQVDLLMIIIKNINMIEHPFAPIFTENSNILILGSFPSVKSRENDFYYGHPQNRFWKVLSSVFNSELPKTIDEKNLFFSITILQFGMSYHHVI